MKKGFLFGLGILLAGGALAATVNTVSVSDTKTPGDPVSHIEFNSLASGINALTDVFDSTISTASNITIPKSITSVTKLIAPEMCLNGDCKTAWPTGGGITDQQCTTGEVVQGITGGTFDCITSGSGADNLGDHIALQHILPDMTGATPMIGDPSGPTIISTRSLGSPTQWFKSVYVEDLHLGNQSLYMNGVKILESDPTVEMTFSADNNQDMTLTTKGDGLLKLQSHDHLLMNIAPGGAVNKDITLKNESKNGKIVLESKTAFAGVPSVNIDSPVVKLGIDASVTPSKTGINMPAGSDPAYTLDVNGDINFTGNLKQNGVDVALGGGVTATTCPSGEQLQSVAADGTFACGADQIGSTSPWSTVTGGIGYSSGNVGVKTTAPLTPLEVGGQILATEFCLNTASESDTCSTKSCTSTFSSGPGGSTCFTQQTLADLENALDNGDDDWAVTPFNTMSAIVDKVGIGTTNPQSKLHVYGGNISIQSDAGTGGDLVAQGSIQVGGHFCPAPEATCTKPGEIASCGAGGAILACAGASSKWMPITSHNGTMVGNNTATCDSTQKGIMRFVESGSPTAEILQICMKNTNSSTYSWRTIMSGGGNAL